MNLLRHVNNLLKDHFNSISKAFFLYILEVLVKVLIFLLGNWSLNQFLFKEMQLLFHLFSDNKLLLLNYSWSVQFRHGCDWLKLTWNLTKQLLSLFCVLDLVWSRRESTCRLIILLGTLSLRSLDKVWFAEERFNSILLLILSLFEFFLLFRDQLCLLL